MQRTYEAGNAGETKGVGRDQNGRQEDGRTAAKSRKKCIRVQLGVAGGEESRAHPILGLEHKYNPLTFEPLDANVGGVHEAIQLSCVSDPWPVHGFL